VEYFTRFQLTARSRGPSATAGLLVYFSCITCCFILCAKFACIDLTNLPSWLSQTNKDLLTYNLLVRRACVFQEESLDGWKIVRNIDGQDRPEFVLTQIMIEPMMKFKVHLYIFSSLTCVTFACFSFTRNVAYTDSAKMS